MSGALLLVTVQNDFLPGGAVGVPDGDAILPLVNALLPRFDTIIASQLRRPGGQRCLARAHPGKRPFETIQLDGKPQVLWPDHCLSGTAGAQFPAALDTARITDIVVQGMHPGFDSFSAFFDRDRRAATGLAGLLRRAELGEISVCGLALDGHVLNTALDAAALGFACTVIEDACRAYGGPAGAQNASAQLRRAGVTLARSDEFPAPKPDR